MATNLAQFNTEISRVAKKMIEENVSKFIIMVSLEVFRRIVLRTPVDTGRARGNWQIEINRPADGVIEIEGEAGEMASAAMARETGKLIGISPFSIVHITNNVPYVYFLEYDKRSSQSPQGMVEITLVEMKDWASKL